MTCKTYRFLYRLCPFTGIRDRLITRHFDSCPACQALFAPEPVFPSMETGAVPDLWPGVEDRLLELENTRERQRRRGHHVVGGPRRAPRHSFTRAWGWTAAGLAAATILLFAVGILHLPFGKHNPSPHGEEKNKAIVINSVTVENRPAKTIYFQPGNKNRLIVWVKKNGNV